MNVTPAEFEFGVEVLLDGAQPQLFEPGDGGLECRLVGEVGQGWATPQGERLVKVRCGGGRIGRLGCLGQKVFESGQVERVAGLDRVPAGVGRDDLRDAQRPAHVGDVHLEGRGCRRGRALPPEVVDQAVSRDDRVAIEEEQRQQEPLLVTAQPQRLTREQDFERSEDAELEFVCRHVGDSLPLAAIVLRMHRAVSRKPGVVGVRGVVTAAAAAAGVVVVLAVPAAWPAASDGYRVTLAVRLTTGAPRAHPIVGLLALLDDGRGPVGAAGEPPATGEIVFRLGRSISRRARFAGCSRLHVARRSATSRSRPEAAASASRTQFGHSRPPPIR